MPFLQLPLVVRIVCFAVPFMAWIMIEEWIIDRHGFDKFLPFYRVGNLCLYDLTVAILLAVGWIALDRSARLK